MAYSKRIEEALKKANASPGDRVRIALKGVAHEGILMPRIEAGDAGCIVLKLQSGYNVGVDFGSGAKLERIGKGAELEKFPVKKIAKSGLPEVALLATGGTIASRVDYQTGAVFMAMTPEEMFFAVPELADVASLSVKQLSNVASEDMSYKNWQQMAAEAAAAINGGARGVVITHGTDTMHYSSAAVSFMLRDLSAPVVFTGSQRSSDRGSSDTAMNLICATHMALSDVAEVGICMHAESGDTFCHFLRGTKARKMHTSRRDAFRPVNAQVLAKVWQDGRMERVGECKARSTGTVLADTKFEPRVALVKSYPGSSGEMLEHFIDKGFKGVVIEGTGLGHAPVQCDNTWLPAIKRAIEQGVMVAMTSQCLYGRTHAFVYRNLRALSDAGVLFCSDMLPEVAYVKLGWVLARAQDDEAKRMMLTNIAGEMNERLTEKEFLA